MGTIERTCICGAKFKVFAGRIGYRKAVSCSLKCSGIARKKTDEQRFFGMVDKRGAKECWPWTGSKDRHGYGYFWLGNKTSRAHKFAITLKEPRDPEMAVDHTCHNKSCVNPQHLVQVGVRKKRIKEKCAKHDRLAMMMSLYKKRYARNKDRSTA